MTTPAAWVEAWRVIPSSRRATVSSSLTRGSFCSSSLRAGFSSTALARLMSSAAGISLATLFASASGMSSARATSRTAAFAFIVPNVMICATFSRPYLRVTYSMTSPAPALAEVDVDVGQRHALGIQEALEDEVVLERIDVGDPQAVRHQAAGRRAAPGADRDAVLARVADEVPDDQEVPGVVHPLDHRDLVREARSRTPRSGAAATPPPAAPADATGVRQSPRAPSARSTRRASSPPGTSKSGR